MNGPVGVGHGTGLAQQAHRVVRPHRRRRRRRPRVAPARQEVRARRVPRVLEQDLLDVLLAARPTRQSRNQSSTSFFRVATKKQNRTDLFGNCCGFYWVLLSFIGFYLVLIGSKRFW